MRKSIIFAAVLVAATVSCQKEIQTPDQAGVFTISASREAFAGTDTKASIDAAGIFTWNSGDAIGIWTGSSFEKLTITDDKAATATFSGDLEGTPSDFAVFPFPYSHYATYSDGAIKVDLPTNYTWKEGEVASPMYAAYDAAGLSFKHLGGVVMVTLKNVPANASVFTFIADKDINGEYTVTTDSDNNKCIQAGNKEAHTEVVFNLPAARNEAMDMVFYVPVPVGTYKFGFDLGAGNNIIFDKQGTTANIVKRAVLLEMPALTCGEASVSNEEALTAAFEKANVKTVILTQDVTLTKSITISSDKVLDLGIHTLTYTGGGSTAQCSAFRVTAGTFTVKGTVKETIKETVKETGVDYDIEITESGITASDDSHTERHIFWANGGKIVLEGETVYTLGKCTEENVTDHYSIVYADNSGIVEIYEGNFKQESTFNILDIDNARSGTIIAKGGTFWNYNPANGDNSGIVTTFVAEGYEIEQNIGTGVNEGNDHYNVRPEGDESGEGEGATG